MSKAVIVSIGTELTRGELLNSNARWLADRLVELGFTVVEHTTVPDDAERIRGTLLRFAHSARIAHTQAVSVIVCTGGLGPTSDDLTTAVVADALGVELVRDATSLAAIEKRYRDHGRTMPAINVKQADFPAGARILSNAVGTAPGFSVQIERTRAYFLPGVPHEMEHIFEAHIAPELADPANGLVERRTHQIHIRTFGLFESAVAERLADLDVGGAKHHPGITIGYRASFPEIEIKILAEAQPGQDEATARTLAEEIASEARGRLQDVAFGGKDETYSQYVANLLKSAQLQVAVAESCTGGLLGKLLTDPPGSSAYVLGGVISYANSVKSGLLGVSEQLLQEHGAVSEEVARAMAEGVLRLTQADLAVGITGIAGPDGGTAQKPVGTVCFALATSADRGGATLTFTERFPGTREFVRTFSAYYALRLFAGAAIEKLDLAKATRVNEA